MFYFNLGVRHITDWQGYDHMLFLLALTLPLSFSLWKPTLRWITAFTLGHSISLAVSALGWVSLPGAWIELAIAVTIAFTVVIHALAGFKVMAHGIWIAGLFGLIHGFGFGSYYTFIAQSESFWWAWLPFNAGIEAGQIAVVLCLLFVYSIFQKFDGRSSAYRWLLSGVVLTLSVQMILNRLPEVFGI